MKKILMIAAVALLAVACNKNQAAVKKLDGTWNATAYSVTDGGVAVDLLSTGAVISSKVTFSDCKLKDDEFCNATTSITYPVIGEFSNAHLYNVTNDGETLQTKDDLSSTTIVQTDIIELTKSMLKLETTDEDGTKTRVTYEKE